MRILKFTAENFRNIGKASFCPSKNCNVFLGENGQGKTNLLEGISLFNGEKSFRHAKETDLICHGKQTARLTVTFFSQGREQTAELIYGEKKQVLLNGIAKRSAHALSGVLCTVVFSPDDLSVVKGGPEERRRMIDDAVTQLIPTYGKLLDTYSHAMFQRNSLLREIKKSGKGQEQLPIWDAKLASLGAKIVRLRRHYIDRISPYAAHHYAGISGQKEALTFKYICSFGEGNDEISLRDALTAAHGKDIEQGVTSVGPHRDDIDILLDKKSARTFGSQGQQRSAVLTMKLSEAEVLREKYGEPPVLLLDDILSELDTFRQSYIVSKLTDCQVFVTCCEKHQSLTGRLYEVKKGHIKRKTSENQSL